MLSILDGAWPTLRLGSALRAHAGTIFFWAFGLTIAYLLSADYSYEAFKGRAIGQATIDNFDISTRTGLYPRGLALFAGLVVALAWGLPRLERFVGERTLAVVNAAALAGLAMLYLVLWRVLGWGTVELSIAAQVLALVLGFLQRRGFGAAITRDLGTDLLWLFTAAFALVVGATEWFAVVGPEDEVGVTAAPLVFAVALALFAVRHVLARLSVDPERAGDRFVHALSVVAVLPALLWIHREAYLVLRQRGVESISAETVRAVAWAMVAVWAAVRAWRGPRLVDELGRLDVERTLGRFVFPWFILGIASVGRWRASYELSTDFLESANSALMIQQLFDFGRWPFFETFNAHGFSDSFFGFVYFVLTGTREIAWYHYDFLYPVAGVVAIYLLSRAMFGVSAPAAFVALCLPYHEELFPDVCVLALFLVFAFDWIVKRSSTLAWFGFGVLILFTFAWRLDIGYAAALATGGALLARWYVVPGATLPWKGIAFGALATFGVLLACMLAALVFRGVEPVAWLVDVAHVVTSNQAFGYTRLTPKLNEIFVAHTFVVPAVLVALFVMLVARYRGKLAPRGPEHLLFAASAFLIVYVWANAPRGLVRHTFMEGGIAMITSFGLAAIAFAPCWWLGQHKRKSTFFLFVLLSSAAAHVFDLHRLDGSPIAPRGNILQRTLGAAAALTPVTSPKEPIDRNPVPKWFLAQHTGRFLEFVGQQIEPQQTFYDLSNSPLLYFHARKPSPHWLNHLLLVYDDRLQSRVLEELARWDAPFALLPADFELTKRDGGHWLAALDEVDFRLRHFALFEDVQSRYQPWGMIQRWPVWVRKDWLQLAPPRSDDARTVWSWQAGELAAERASPDERATMLQIGDAAAQRLARVAFSWRTSSYLRLVLRAPSDGGTLDLGWSVDTRATTMRETRALRVPGGESERFYLLPSAPGESEIGALTLRARAGVEIAEVELVTCTSEESTAINSLVHAGITTQLRELARLWAEHAPPARDGDALLRTLHDAAQWPGPKFSMALAASGPPPFEGPIARDGRSVLLEKLDDAQGVRRGDAIVFDDGTRRIVERIEGRIVHLEGEPLRLEPAPTSFLLFPVRLQGRPAVANQWTRFDFEPLSAEEARRTYLLIALRTTTPQFGPIAIDYGLGELSHGRFTFNPVPDGEVREYAVRLSTQYNWMSRPNAWIGVSPTSGAVEVVSAKLVRGD